MTRGLIVDNEWVMNVLEKNKGKHFVKRILNRDKYPTLPLDDRPGMVGTHLMTWGEADGKYYAYPQILWDGKKLVRYPEQDAFRKAFKTGNVIEFNSADEADIFTKRYKAAWGE